MMWWEWLLCVVAANVGYEGCISHFNLRAGGVRDADPSLACRLRHDGQVCLAVDEFIPDFNDTEFKGQAKACNLSGHHRSEVFRRQAWESRPHPRRYGDSGSRRVQEPVKGCHVTDVKLG